MRCPDCRTENDREAVRCGNCGYPFGERHRAAATTAAEGEVKSCLVPAGILLLVGYVVFGVPAVIFAIRTQLHLAQEEKQAARQSSARARLWCWIGLSVTLAVWGLQIAAALWL